MHWIEQLARLTRQTLIDDEDMKAYIKLRCYPGELAELPDPEYPLICFKIEPQEGDLGYIEGTIKFWVWCKAEDPRLYDIFARLKTLFHKERVSYQDMEDRKLHVVFKIQEPIRNLEPKFGVQVLLSRSTFKGIET